MVSRLRAERGANGRSRIRAMSSRTRAAAAVLALAIPAVGTPDEPPGPPGATACPYPPRAREQQVAGTVRFAATVRADGSVASVEIRRVPAPGLGFEEIVRDCVSAWRLAPAERESARVHEGRVRFRLSLSEEGLVRTRLEELAKTWNEQDPAAVNELAARPEEAVADIKVAPTSLFDQLQALTRTAPRQLRLADDVELFWFTRPDFVKVRQRYSPLEAAPAGAAGPAESGDSGPAESPGLDAALMKGPRGWRFALLVATPARKGPLRVGAQVPEPRKLKNVPPDYPEVAKQARVQGVVILEAVISPDGDVAEVKVLRGIPLLDAAAIEAVRQWRYTPTYLNGVAVPVIMTVTVNFKLSFPPR